MDVKVCPRSRERNPGSGFHAKKENTPELCLPVLYVHTQDKSETLELVCIVAPKRVEDYLPGWQSLCLGKIKNIRDKIHQ